MTPAQKKMVGLVCVVASVFLILGSFYLPSDFIGGAGGILLASGIVLLLAGNALIVFGTDR